ncbi:GNAT family N-acetyltransferase [Enterococcus sp. LJL99]
MTVINWETLFTFFCKKEMITDNDTSLKKEKPRMIRIGKKIRLVQFDFLREEALDWYQDPESMQDIMGKPVIYTREQIREMYLWQNKHGMLYYIEYELQGRFRTIGDVWLAEDDYAIVIDKKYRNRHIGRIVTQYFIHKAEVMDREFIIVSEIFNWNKASQRMFKNLNFYPYKKLQDSCSYRRNLKTVEK